MLCGDGLPRLGPVAGRGEGSGAGTLRAGWLTDWAARLPAPRSRRAPPRPQAGATTFLVSGIARAATSATAETPALARNAVW